MESHIPFVEEGTYPVREGNRVQPLIGGKRAFRRICQAVEEARRSVWVTVAFLQPDIELPEGRGHLFNVLDRAAARGLDVRALFWRSPEVEAYEPGTHFLGTLEDHKLLERRRSTFLARWDRLDRTYCHHQKSWIIDAGARDEVAFVGGINLNNSSLTEHPFSLRPAGHTQDIYCEVQGPVATDAHHNFVQRWNGASERYLPLGAWPTPERVRDLEFPHQASGKAGEATVQLTRTIRRGFYSDDTPTPGGRPFPVREGEASVLKQYLLAIEAAREAIYLENQFFMSPDVLERIEAALQRGVEVVAVVPGSPADLVREARRVPALALTFERLARLGQYERFTLAGLAASRSSGTYEEIYVHTKAAIVDDVWATIGSTNIANRSFFGDTELNASFWHPESVRSFRVDLLSAHQSVDTSSLEFTAALADFRKRTSENRHRREKREPLAGFAYALDPETWGIS